MVIHAGDEVLLRKGSEGKLMADLYEFPYCESELEEFMQSFPFPVVFEKNLVTQSHSFTRYKAHLFPSLWETFEKRPVNNYQWISWKKIGQLPFSAGHRRILNTLAGENAHFTY